MILISYKLDMYLHDGQDERQSLEMSIQMSK